VIRAAIIFAATLAVTPALGVVTDDEVFTLYRDSVMSPTMRIHVATFDADEKRDYNAENCRIAADLFQHQEGVQVHYWCELGRYRK
jgi:hypothetical protein